MQVGGTVYGVALNDGAERAALGDRLAANPYGAPPVAPVVYIKPRNCLQTGGGMVRLPAEASEAVIGSTLALHIANAVSGVSQVDAMRAIGAVALAADISLPETDYYRPAIAEKCRDGFLPMGQVIAVDAFDDTLVIETCLNGEKVHEWSLGRLHRTAADLITELSAFMTLEPGDVLLLGLAGDSARGSPGAQVVVRAAGFPELTFAFGAEDGR